MPLNDFQKIAAQVYGSGDYSYMQEPDEANDVGDTLFRFIICELGEGEDCDDLETAISRMRMARDDVESVLTALQDKHARENP